MSGRRPYTRSMNGWWRRDPFFVRYMIREATALIVAAYAIVLLAGVLALAQGEAAWIGWLAAMRNPFSIALNVLMLLGMIFLLPSGVHRAMTDWRVVAGPLWPGVALVVALVIR